MTTSTSTNQLQKNLWFAYLCAIIAWSGNAYAEIGRYIHDGTQFARVIDGHPFVNDSVQFYNAACLAQRCKGGELNIYDPDVQDRALRSLIAPIVPEANLFLQYPPQYYALSLPFSFFPMLPAYILWCASSLVLILITMWYFGRAVLTTTVERVFAFAGSLGCFPAWLSFELGQPSLFQFPATLAFWILMRAEKYFYAGLLSAFLLVKLQYMPVFILVGVLLGRMKYVTGLLISGSLLALATVLTVGWKNIANYPAALKFGETNPKVGGIDPQMMQNFRGELVLLTGTDKGVNHLIALGIFGLGLLLICGVWLKLYPALKKSTGIGAFGVAAALSLLISLIASPHTHIQEFFTAIIAVIFLYQFLKTEPINQASRALTVLLLGYPAFSWVFYILLPFFQLAKVEPFFLWDLAVLILTGAVVRKRLVGPLEVDGSVI